MTPPATMTPAAQQVAAVAMWMAIWWLTAIIPVGATALIPFVLFPILGVMSGDEAIGNFSHWIIFLMMGGFMLAASMERWNLHRRIALSVIHWLGATPRTIVLGFMIATSFISMWISNTSTTLMMLPIATAVLKKFIETGDAIVEEKFAPALMLSIAYAASIGGTATLIGTPPNGIFAGQAASLFGQEISFVQWLALGLPFVFVLIPITWWYLVRIQYSLPQQIGQFSQQIIKRELESLGRMNRGETIVAIVFAVTATGWIFRNEIAIGSLTIPGIATFIPSIDNDAIIALTAVVVLFSIPIDIHKRIFVLDMKSAIGIPWDILLIFAGGICLANGFSATGLSEWLAHQLSFLQNLHPYVILFFCVGMVTFLTEITSNAATATVLVPIMASLSIGVGQHPYFLMIPCTFAVSMAYMFPVATPPNAIVFGSQLVTIQQMVKTGFFMNLISILVITILFICFIQHIVGIDLNTIPDWAR